MLYEGLLDDISPLSVVDNLQDYFQQHQHHQLFETTTYQQLQQHYPLPTLMDIEWEWDGEVEDDHSQSPNGIGNKVETKRMLFPDAHAEIELLRLNDPERYIEYCLEYDIVPVMWNRGEEEEEYASPMMSRY